MNLETVEADFYATLKSVLDKNNHMTQMLEYACIPAGKLFRPKLVYALASDLNILENDHKMLASAIEIHHAYSLVHDDLPSMDDDDMRRGKPSLHKEFNEWKAILTGDALLGLSFELLTKMKSPNTLEIIKLFSQYTGKDGLIYGQYLDLSHANKSFEDLCFLHGLKTGKLISFSLEASFMISPSSNSLQLNEVQTLGSSLGLIFQLIDDLSELNEEIDQHEEDINAFLNFGPQIVMDKIQELDLKVKNIISEHKLENIQEIYMNYLNKMIKPLDISHINEILEFEVDSIKELLN